MPGPIEMGGRLPLNTHGGQLGEAYIHGMNGIAEAGAGAAGRRGGCLRTAASRRTGPGWDGLPLDARGIRPDPGRTRCYRLLRDLSS